GVLAGGAVPRDRLRDPHPVAVDRAPLHQGPGPPPPPPPAPPPPGPPRHRRRRPDGVLHHVHGGRQRHLRGAAQRLGRDHHPHPPVEPAHRPHPDLPGHLLDLQGPEPHPAAPGPHQRRRPPPPHPNPGPPPTPPPEGG